MAKKENIPPASDSSEASTKRFNKILNRSNLRENFCRYPGSLLLSAERYGQLPGLAAVGHKKLKNLPQLLWPVPQQAIPAILEPWMILRQGLAPRVFVHW